MPEACVSLWPTDACQWSVAQIWSFSDWVERAIYISLALMLAYTFLAAIQLFRRYRLARRVFREFESDFGPEFFRSGRRLIADLNRGLTTLKAIASTAPFLGLAGTSYGILEVFSYGYSGSKARFLAIISKELSLTLATTIVGILVAIPATLSHNILQACIERHTAPVTLSRSSRENDLRSFHFAQTLQLKPRFSSVPPFALLAAPALACVVAMFMAFEPYERPTGLHISMAPERCQPGLVNRIIVLRVTNDGKLFLNTESEDWKSLPGRLLDIYRIRRERVLYVYAEDAVPFQTVTTAIDLVRNIPATESGSIGLDVRLVTPQPEAENALCHGPVRRAPRAHPRR